MKTKRLLAGTLVIMTFLVSCSSQSNDPTDAPAEQIAQESNPTVTPLTSVTTPTPESTNTPTKAPTSTFTPTPSITPLPTQTTAPSVTPSSTPIPEELLEQIRVSFGTVLFVQGFAEVLNETAIQRNTDQINGLEAFGAILAVATMIDELEEASDNADHAEILKPSVEKSLSELQLIKDIIARWVNNEIVSSEVIEELGPIREEMSLIAEEVDDILADELKLDRDRLREYRDEIMEEFTSVFDELGSE